MDLSPGNLRCWEDGRFSNIFPLSHVISWHPCARRWTVASTDPWCAVHWLRRGRGRRWFARVWPPRELNINVYQRRPEGVGDPERWPEVWLCCAGELLEGLQSGSGLLWGVSWPWEGRVRGPQKAGQRSLGVQGGGARTQGTVSAVQLDRKALGSAVSSWQGLLIKWRKFVLT